METEWNGAASPQQIATTLTLKKCDELKRPFRQAARHGVLVLKNLFIRITRVTCLKYRFIWVHRRACEVVYLTSSPQVVPCHPTTLRRDENLKSKAESQRHPLLLV